MTFLHAFSQSLPPLHVRTTVPADSLPGERYLNTATVSSPTVDPNPDNNVGRATIGVVPPGTAADIDVQKVVGNPAPQEGDTIRFGFRIINFGPDTANMSRAHVQ